MDVDKLPGFPVKETAWLKVKSGGQVETVRDDTSNVWKQPIDLTT